MTKRNNSDSGASKTSKQKRADHVARAVGAGREVKLNTVDFNNPNRPPTCLEVDFPILDVNHVAKIEIAVGKPIYQMSKWWARRRSSVFRSMLIAAATEAPCNGRSAAKEVWKHYYANHQKLQAFKDIKVADIFMGGGTTLVEGARLGMDVTGNDLNPVAWFVVKHALSGVDPQKVLDLLADIEAEVKPHIMPYYCCDGPHGESGAWTHLPTGDIMPTDFDPLGVHRNERRNYSYAGPEMIYTFWSKHGPCSTTGCGHRTPIMQSKVMAVKELSIKYWDMTCDACGLDYHLEDHSPRMAPGVALYIAPNEHPFTELYKDTGARCPDCGRPNADNLGSAKKKKVQLTLLLHPQWLSGCAGMDADGRVYGGSAQDGALDSARWQMERSKNIKLLEVRGTLPDVIKCPETGLAFDAKGTVPARSTFACASCGTAQDVLTSIKATGRTGPVAAYAVQCFSPQRKNNGLPYGGRYFAPFGQKLARQYAAAAQEWEERKEGDLKDYWPRSPIPLGAEIGPHDIEGHHFSHWHTMFNPRQLLIHALLLKAIMTAGDHAWETREYVLGAFQQYLNLNNGFCHWAIGSDRTAQLFSGNNFHPKSSTIENNLFAFFGYGNWVSCTEGLLEGLEWAQNPWEIVSAAGLAASNADAAIGISGKSEKVFPGDAMPGADVKCASSTDLSHLQTASIDLVITDPPFGGILQYAELSDFFYVWLRLALRDSYPEHFGTEYTPKALEVVANPYRERENPNAYYQKLLTQCWREAHRALKPGGILAFTFHHNEDHAWVSVLESLFDAGFVLVATYPIRSDDTKGEGQFGSKKVEYDIIHVCRKRVDTKGAPEPITWPRLRRRVAEESAQLKAIIENHAHEGLALADLQVIRRGKALEHYSRHYGAVRIGNPGDERVMTVAEALKGIHQIMSEDGAGGREMPPVEAEPITREFLMTFGSEAALDRDQLQKYLRGTGTEPAHYTDRGWCFEANKVFTRTRPLDFARAWVGKHKRRLTNDLDQALVLMGACTPESGINARDTLDGRDFKPHPALAALLDWHSRKGPDQETRQAANTALMIYNAWKSNREAVERAKTTDQPSLFDNI